MVPIEQDGLQVGGAAPDFQVSSDLGLPRGKELVPLSWPVLWSGGGAGGMGVRGQGEGRVSTLVWAFFY